MGREDVKLNILWLPNMLPRTAQKWHRHQHPHQTTDHSPFLPAISGLGIQCAREPLQSAKVTSALKSLSVIPTRDTFTYISSLKILGKPGLNPVLT